MARNLTQIKDDAYIPPELIALTHQSVTPEQFEELCREYSELRLELTSTGELIVMPPAGFNTGVRNANLTSQLVTWARKDGRGLCTGSSAIYVLPNGARRAPDAAWVKRERVVNLTKEQQEGFGPFCPDFVVEIRSPSDGLAELRNKMVEYIENGASLGWLIDPFKRQVYVYQANQDVVILDNPETVSGDPLLPGFTLDLTRLW